MHANDLYASVTNQIITALESGDLRPWTKGWETGLSSLPLRHNGQNYRGCNIILLWLTAITKGYSSPYFMTFRQAKELGGCVRKGERSSPVLWCQQRKKEETAEDGTKDESRFWISKVFPVFNASQISGLPDHYYAKPIHVIDGSQRIEHCEAFVSNTGANIIHEGYAACYQPISDRIRMPAFESFHTPAGYYSTLLHELNHWTGVPHRLNRFTFVDKTNADYAQEEIVAELGACFLAAQLGIEPTCEPDHAAYLDHWIKALKENPRYIFKAASQAQAACDYLNAQQPEE